MDRTLTLQTGTLRMRAVVVAGLVGVVLVAYLVGHAGGGEAQAAEVGETRTVTVQGVGHVSVVPDQLAFTLAVGAGRPDLETALAYANTAMQRVVDALVAQGVAKEDVQTTDVSMYPEYSRKPRAVTGYRVSQSVSVVVDDLGRANDVVSAAVGAGGTEVRLDGLRLQVDDPEASLAPARAAAYEQARAKAAEYADQVGAELGEVVRVSELGDQQPYAERELAYSVSDSAAAGSIPIQAGQSDLTASVTAVFALT